MRVALAGGGTAGHIEPALATADEIRRHDPAAGVTFLGTERGLETRLVPERGYDLDLIPAVPLPRRLTPRLLRVPRRVQDAVRRTAEILEERRVDVVVGFGGYVALPAYLAARKSRIPLVIHEANTRPGLANRIGARFTEYVAVASESVRLPHSSPIGIPLRRSIATLDRDVVRPEAVKLFDLDPDRSTLLVFGGSQGARRLNQAVVGAADSLIAQGAQIVHAVGRQDEGDDYGAPGYHRVSYIDRMDLAYAAADLVVCRAGAITCAEVAAVGLPAVFVPLPHGNGEQRHNAEPIVDAGGGVLVNDADLTSEWITSHVPDVLNDSSRRQAMSQATSARGYRDADERLVRMIYRATGAEEMER